MNLKMAPFPLSCWKAAGIFSSIYWICSSSWRQISPYCGSLPFDKVPLWFVCTEPPAIHQTIQGFLTGVISPSSFPSWSIAALVSHNSLYLSVCLLSLCSWGLFCVLPSAMNARRVVDFLSVCSAFFLVVWMDWWSSKFFKWATGDPPFLFLCWWTSASSFPLSEILLQWAYSYVSCKILRCI